MKFEWDDAKATANERKHGVTFPEAATAFADPPAAILPAPLIPRSGLATSGVCR